MSPYIFGKISGLDFHKFPSLNIVLKPKNYEIMSFTLKKCRDFHKPLHFCKIGKDGEERCDLERFFLFYQKIKDKKIQFVPTVGDALIRVSPRVSYFFFFLKSYSFTTSKKVLGGKKKIISNNFQ